jgi:peptidoglycan/xylan/chitin deacetylase (PgdA/CDA1 family)
VSVSARDVAVVAAGLVAPRPDRRIAVLHDVASRDRFVRLIDFLQERWDVTTLDAVLEPGPAPRPRLALTFDDGYASWHSVAAPELVSRGLPAVFFVCSGWVGLTGGAARTFVQRQLRRTADLRPLEVGQVAELASCDGLEVGSHTADHADAGAAGGALTAGQLREDRQRLEAWTARPVRWFAYPFGQPENVPDAAVDAARAAGFDAAFTTVPGAAEPGGDRFRMPRQSIDPDAGPRRWLGRLNGGYERLYRLRTLTRRGAPAR